MTAPASIHTGKLTRTFHENWQRGIDPKIWTPHYTFLGDTDQTAAKFLDRRGFAGERELYVDPAFCGIDANGQPLSSPLGLNPFSINKKGLTITASRTPPADLAACGNRPFVSGVLDTAKGFSQLHGYFEWIGIMPSDGAGKPIPGCWPAFWHLTQPPTLKLARIEADPMESVGEVDKYHATLHWPADVAGGKPNKNSTGVHCPGLYDGKTPRIFGTYWSPTDIGFYLGVAGSGVDPVLVAAMPTPAACSSPWTLLVNLAIGGNWPDSVYPHEAAANYPALTSAQFRCIEANVYSL